MNVTQRTKRALESPNGVGAVLEEVPFTPPADVPVTGVLRGLVVSKRAGTATQCEVVVKAGSGGVTIYNSGGLNAMPFVVNELFRYYELAPAADLVAEVRGDAGEDNNLDVTLIVQGA